ncbi:MAG: adenylyl-sulfate reductase subunit alpha [Oscillospiraceae bacterium]|jgi:adenylylsulfate reductase subunit A|nr:adenylyl-sulfate reductase subunit alpha [Oscillospiraceae bacterium]
MQLRTEKIETDFLVIGGGTAGCWAALTFCGARSGRVLIVEKADIRRSGCLAAGVNALNAYIGRGKSPQDYVDYARVDAAGIVRGDLLLTMAERLNGVTGALEGIGLTILKNNDGSYAQRGWRNVKINGENIKPLLADAVRKQAGITVMNRVNVFAYIVKNNRICGAYAVSIDAPVLYVLSAKATLVATGGAAGLYRPNNPGFSRHKMWYSPFNTGAGLAMGIRAGAEMTTLEMRFIALRCKDTIAPTGTLAQGAGARQINARGEMYEDTYGITTSARVYGTLCENAEGRGPCYLKTVGVAQEQDMELQKAYLNMAPSQTLRWVESGRPPSAENVPIAGTEPYISGGHTAGGYHVSTKRETTVKGLFAAGDVAGGCPQKYVTGALAEGEIAALAATAYMGEHPGTATEAETEAIRAQLEGYLRRENGASADVPEEAMQSLMDEYAGGISRAYRYTEASLTVAEAKITALERQSELLAAGDMRQLVYILELRERLTLCRAVIAHLLARKETRWHSFAAHGDFPHKSGAWDCYVNSVYTNGAFKTFTRPLVTEGESYEH